MKAPLVRDKNNLSSTAANVYVFFLRDLIFLWLCLTSFFLFSENMYHLRPSTRWFRFMTGSSAAWLAHSPMPRPSPRLQSFTCPSTGETPTWIHWAILLKYAHRENIFITFHITFHTEIISIKCPDWLLILFMTPGQRQSYTVVFMQTNIYNLCATTVSQSYNKHTYDWLRIQDNTYYIMSSS